VGVVVYLSPMSTWLALASAKATTPTESPSGSGRGCSSGRVELALAFTVSPPTRLRALPQICRQTSTQFLSATRAIVSSRAPPRSALLPQLAYAGSCAVDESGARYRVAATQR